MLSVIKDSVELYNLAMVDETLNFYFFQKLLAYFFLLYLGLLDDFDRKNHPSFFVSGLKKCYFAILTLPNLPLPKSLPSSKSVILSCFKFLYEARVEIVYLRSPFSK